MFAIFATLVAIIVSALFYQSKRPNPEKIFGIYSQPGRWYYIKLAAFWTLLTLRRIKYKVASKSSFVKFDRIQPLSNDPKAFDAVFFQAVTQDGFALAAGTERRHQAKVNGLCYLMTPDHGLLLSEKLPKTVLEADPACIMLEKEWGAEGIKFTPVEPMKRWNISFHGKMRSFDDPSKIVNVKLDGQWTSDLPWFLFELDLPSKVIAEAIALETWNKELFQALKDAHQTHYEQMGYLKVTIKIDNRVYNIKMDAFRDHSFGMKRDWTLMHRYIFHMFYLEDGTRVSLGVISQPCTSSHMTFGFMIDANKRMFAIDSCDLLLYQHAEDGTPPNNLAFTFVANKTNYEAKIKYDVTAVHYVGNDVEAKMHERFLSCEINGVKGKGISEWHYNNVNK
ncbi:uncharacterized protein LOC109606860 [Aethina tumida]|uniref:uncharacterized protein LOC109606860 n=1 Tax=Aethina tumida TaxID=116153 RepID=UPI00096B1078|nr:uncharacterized protein LOC109606860 [Aethina tumida]